MTFPRIGSWTALLCLAVALGGCAAGASEGEDAGGGEGEGELVGCESLSLQPSAALDVAGEPHLFAHDIPAAWVNHTDVIAGNSVLQQWGMPTDTPPEWEGAIWTISQGDAPIDAEGRDEAVANYKGLGWPDTWGTVDFYGEDIEILEQRLNNIAAARMWLPAESTVGVSYYELVLTLRFLDNDPACNEPVNELFDDIMATFGPNPATTFTP